MALNATPHHHLLGNHELLFELPPDMPFQHTPYNVGSRTPQYPPLHLVCVHGFRGDHTSFQRFPTDLHCALDIRIPSLETHVYPTYKSKKSLQVAAERLISWLDTLEPGFIILIGHSLGGFVVAEAALQMPKGEGKSEIIGVVAMDVPYLGIHPHVVVSGIASLLPSGKLPESEHKMNDQDKVDMVDAGEAKAKIGVESRSPSPSPSSSRVSLASSSSSARSEATVPLPDLTPGPTMFQSAVHFFRKHSSQPFTAMKDWVVSTLEHGSVLLDPEGLRTRYKKLEAWPGDWVNFYTETVPSEYARGRTPKGSSTSSTPSTGSGTHIAFATPRISDSITPVASPPQGSIQLTGSPPAIIAPLHVHSEMESSLEPEPEPFTPVPSDEDHLPPAYQAISPTLAQSGSPIPAVATPTRLIRSPPAPRSPSPSTSRPPSSPTPSGSSTRSVSKLLKTAGSRLGTGLYESEKAAAALKEQERLREADAKTPRHFIITPLSFASKAHWERVAVAGSPHEVDAHCGIFFKEKNWDYDDFVRRVADWIEKCCQKRAPAVMAY